MKEVTKKCKESAMNTAPNANQQKTHHFDRNTHNLNNQSTENLNTNYQATVNFYRNDQLTESLITNDQATENLNRKERISACDTS